MAVWGQARKEVLSNKPLILKRIGEGSSIRSIWIELKQDGRVSVALRNFNCQVKIQLGYVPGKPLPSARSPMVAPTSSTVRATSIAPRNTNTSIDTPSASNPVGDTGGSESILPKGFVHNKLPDGESW